MAYFIEHKRHTTGPGLRVSPIYIHLGQGFRAPALFVKIIRLEDENQPFGGCRSAARFVHATITTLSGSACFPPSGWSG